GSFGEGRIERTHQGLQLVCETPCKSSQQNARTGVLLRQVLRAVNKHNRLASTRATYDASGTLVIAKGCLALGVVQEYSPLLEGALLPNLLKLLLGSFKHKSLFLELSDNLVTAKL